MEYQHKGSTEIKVITALAVAVIVSFAFIYIWSKGLPIETQNMTPNLG